MLPTASPGCRGLAREARKFVTCGVAPEHGEPADRRERALGDAAARRGDRMTVTGARTRARRSGDGWGPREGRASCVRGPARDLERHGWALGAARPERRLGFRRLRDRSREMLTERAIRLMGPRAILAGGGLHVRVRTRAHGIAL